MKKLLLLIMAVFAINANANSVFDIFSYWKCMDAKKIMENVMDYLDFSIKGFETGNYNYNIQLPIDEAFEFKKATDNIRKMCIKDDIAETKKCYKKQYEMGKKSLVIMERICKDIDELMNVTDSRVKVVK